MYYSDEYIPEVALNPLMLSDAGISCIQRRSTHGTHKRIPLIDGKGEKEREKKKRDEVPDHVK